MRAFVTGGQGFVGPWLRRHLEASGDEVIAAGAGVDVTDADALGAAVEAARPDAVYHLAAQASVRTSWDNVASTYSVNTLGTVNLLAAVRAAAPGARVLLVSSAEVYGLVDPAELPLPEGAPFRPATPYAASKAAAELAGLQAHLGWGLDVVRVRPFNHTGPGQDIRFFVPSMAQQMVAAASSGDNKLRTGNLTAARDFSDVRDVVRAYRLLVEHGRAGEVYNVCSGLSVSMECVVRRMLDLCGSDLQVVTDPERLRPVDLPDLRGDSTRLRQATGWAPACSLDQTLADVLDDWRRRATWPGSPKTC